MESGFVRASKDATRRGSTSGKNLYHQRLAPYPITPMSAARHTGTSPPTRTTKPMIVPAMIMRRIHGWNARRKSVRNIISIITFDPLTTMICIRPDAFRDSFKVGSRLFFCQRIMPESISSPTGGKISPSLRANQLLIRTKREYFLGGILSV